LTPGAEPSLLQTVRGFPPIHILAFSIAFALLAIPLMHLTGSSIFPAPAMNGSDGSAESPAGANGSKAPEEKRVSALVRLRYAHKPLSMSLTQDGKELLKNADLSASTIEVKAAIGVSHAGNEVMLAATWPPGTPETPLTLEIEPDGYEARSETRWASDAELNEVITFQW
jgi:hypothetical protein